MNNIKINPNERLLLVRMLFNEANNQNNVTKQYVLSTVFNRLEMKRSYFGYNIKDILYQAYYMSEEKYIDLSTQDKLEFLIKYIIKLNLIIPNITHFHDTSIQSFESVGLKGLIYRFQSEDMKFYQEL